MRKNTRMKKFRGKRIWLNIKRVLKAVLKNVYYFIVGITSFIITVYLATEKVLLKGFKKLPMWLKRVLVLTLLINTIITNNKGAEVIEKIVTNIEIEEIYVVKEVVQEIEPVEECSLGEYECAIYDEAIEQGLTEEQAKITIAISKHETANYTSKLFVNSNNVGGLYNSSAKKFYKFDSLEDGIESFVRNLKKGYFDKGLDTIEEIQTKYAPINAANDPTNLNSHWVGGVQRYYNELA